MGKDLPRIAETELVRSDDGAHVLAVVSNGGTGPLSAVRLASVAHSRTAPTPRAVAVLGDMRGGVLWSALGMAWGQAPLCAAGGASHNGRP